ncbi:MAG: hypothetical protein ACE5HE_08170 [Phycisphaerae bacterium]
MSTTPSRASAGARYFRYLAYAVAATVVMLALGYVPTVKLAGEGGLSAMLAGSGISLIAYAIGAIPPVLIKSTTSVPSVGVVLGATAVRLMIVVGLSVSVVLSDWFHRGPLLVWVALSYMASVAIGAAAVIPKSDDTD